MKVVCIKKDEYFEVGLHYFYEKSVYYSYFTDHFDVFYDKIINGIVGRTYNKYSFEEFFQTVQEYRDRKIDLILF